MNKREVTVSVGPGSHREACRGEEFGWSVKAGREIMSQLGWGQERMAELVAKCRNSF